MSLYADDLVKIETLARRVAREEFQRLVEEAEAAAKKGAVLTPTPTPAKQPAAKQVEKPQQAKVE